MEKRKPEHIVKILNQLFRGNEWEDRLQASLPLLRWQEVVGVHIARQTQPEFMQDGVLHVKVGNSVWLNHLRFLSEELRQKLNEELSCPEIQAIRFRHGPLDPISPPPSSAATKATELPRALDKAPSPLGSEEKSLLDEIQDLQLRQALEALLRKQREHSRKWHSSQECSSRRSGR